jgi:DGQHR domain-containing protein
MAGVKKKRKKNIKLSTEEKAFNRKKKALKSKIRNTIKQMGFEYLRTEQKPKTFGVQRGEFDSVYLYKNIILFCEDSIEKKPKDHIKKKSIFFEDVGKNFESALNWLKKEFPDKFLKFENFSTSRYKYFFLYIHPEKILKETKNIFPNIHFIDSNTLEYFKFMANNIKISSRQELFKFLNIGLSDIGISSSSDQEHVIEASVILPEDNSGYKGIPIVSFLMSAEDLMDCAYVLRKENPQDDLNFYQRLISRYRILDIRKFLATQERTFINNIIVSLPTDVEFLQNDKPVEIGRVSEISQVKIRIKKKINSICIIDGQHRVFSHYRAHSNEKYEKEISKIRSAHHLLVTGLYFPKNYNELDKVKAESELFLQINSKQRKVKPDLLQHIEALQKRDSPIGIANQVLKKLNDNDPFLEKFRMSEFERHKIKTPSLLKYGLKDLVEMDENKETLFKYWEHKNLWNSKNKDYYDSGLQEYISFCTNAISQYFSAIKSNFRDHWKLGDKESKLLSVTSLIAFLISFKKSLALTGGPKEFEYYKNIYSKLNTDFSKDNFKYVSSQWNKFVDEIVQQCWENLEL